MTLTVLLLGQMMASLGGSILSVAAPAIRNNLHLSGGEVQVVLAAYVLAYAVLLVTGASLGEIHGPRRLFLIGAGGYVASSVVSGLAPNIGILVAAAVALGASAALMVPQVLTLIQITFQGTDRARAVGLYSMVLAVGVALAQVLGGLLITANLFGLTWRPVFLVNVPLGLLLLAAGRFVLPTVPGRHTKRLDLAGVLALSLGMVLLVVPLTFGSELGWPNWIWICFAAAAVAISGFVAVEISALRTGQHPLLDLRVLAIRGVTPGLLVVAVTMGGYGGFAFTVSQHLQLGLGFTPLAAGLTFVPYAVGFAALSLSWSRLADQVQRWLPSAGLAALAVADGVLALRLRSGWTAAFLPLLVLAGAGHAAAFSPLVAQIARRAGVDAAAAVSALLITSVQIAIVVGVTALGSLYFTLARSGDAASSGQALTVVCVAVAATTVLSLGFSVRVATRA